ncbi:aromatic amino acid DMT transporter YddG [Herbaspirillum sp. LeCh32-8]|nr:aromatic amino acid DMT transporter YddG [Herbaspirillum sp. LeCh32-8]
MKDISASTSTLIGMSAVLMWSASLGLIRSIAEIFGAAGGGALIFTASAAFATLSVGWPRVRELPRAYLLGSGALFVAYEVALALSVGMAHGRAQALELGMINYLWPSLTILLATLMRQQRGSWLLPPAILLCFAGIVWVMKGDGAWSPALLWANIQSNPPAYALAFGAAILWAAYSVLTRRVGNGKNAVPLFLVATATLLWIKYALSAEPALSFNLAGVAQVLVLSALTATAYSCWNHGVQHGSITLLATASYFAPVLSALLASAWLGVRPGAGFFQGVVMVTAGSFACWWATRRRG